MLLCIGTKYEVCMFNSLRYGQLLGENVYDLTMTPIQSLWNLNINLTRAHLCDIPNFILIKYKRTEIQSREISKELWRKTDITSLRPWSLLQGHHFQWGLSQRGKQPFNEIRVQIGASVQLEICSLTDRQTDRQTHSHTQTNWNENITLYDFCGVVKTSFGLQ